MELQQFRVIVRRLRIRTPTADALALQQRVAEMAAGADLHGSLLGPAAVLCIRRLDDPRPRTLRLADRCPRPAPDWESAARSRISDLATRAARPALGPVPASAEAVLFLDRAELIACLARDWSDSLTASCWWWRALFGATDDAARVVSTWREQPEHVPAACHLLATWRRLTPFIERLPPAGVVSLIHDVARAFGTDAVERALATRSGVWQAAGEAGDRRAVGEVPPATAGVAHNPRRLPTWARYVPELADLVLAPEQRVLAAVSLLLHRSPSEARRILSPDTVESLLTETAVPASIAPAPEPKTPIRPRAVTARAAVTWPEVGDVAVAGGMQEDDLVPDLVALPPASAVGDVDALELPAQRDQAALPEYRPVYEVVETALGGAFYLINVAIDRGLYGDFTMPRSPGIDLPIWDFIALVAMRLVDSERFHMDPIAPFLARLAGRTPSEPAGASFVPDMPTEHTLDDWLDALVPGIVARLSGALGIPEGAVGELTIGRAARVALSPSHLDVRFALDDLPIDIRLAGLDRNPGFVPAAGLTVTFAYV